MEGTNHFSLLDHAMSEDYELNKKIIEFITIFFHGKTGFDNFEIDLLIISTLSSTLKITFFIEPE